MPRRLIARRAQFRCVGGEASALRCSVIDLLRWHSYHLSLCGNVTTPLGRGIMYRAVALQTGFALLGVMLAAVFWGADGALAALAGGFACIVPNALFACLLSHANRVPGLLQGMAFFWGEFTKLFLVMLILVVLAWLFPGLKWGGVVIGLIVTLQANFLVFLVKP